jgi:aspartyl-tRNA(Asn)/glutamyl-tRNA(Gln) amidotransferase subunit B
MRSKEDAHDYRYFPDPDLLPLAIAPDWIEKVREEMPELPQAMRERFEREYGLSPYDATQLTQSLEMANFFEETVSGGHNLSGLYKLAANWMIGEVAANLNRLSIDFSQTPISPGQLAGLLRRMVDGTISGRMAKEVFNAMWDGAGQSADAIIDARGLRQISDTGSIEKTIDEVLAANQKSVEEFRAGKEKAFNALVGQVMKATKGKANPQQVNELLKKKLAG